jgi:hypothetical protein
VIAFCREAEVSPLRYYKAKRYALHSFKAETGWRILLLTNAEASDWSETLRGFYESVFVPLIIRNPLVTPGAPIVSTTFEEAADVMLRAAGATISSPSAIAASGASAAASAATAT